MLDYYKTQALLLKALTKKEPRCGKFNLGDYTGFTPDGFHTFIVPTAEFFIAGCPDMPVIEKLYAGVFISAPAEQTEIKMLPALHGTKTRMVFKFAAAHGCAWVGEDMLKDYGKDYMVSLSREKPQTSPVYISSRDGIPMGFIMPTRVKDGDDSK